MKCLYITGYNTKIRQENLKMAEIFDILAKLSRGYERIVINLSSSLEMSIFKFFKEASEHQIFSSEELGIKFTEVEYENYMNSLNLVSNASPKLKSDILVSRKFMSEGSDILLLEEKDNGEIVKNALMFAKELGVHSYAVEIENLKLTG